MELIEYLVYIKNTTSVCHASYVPSAHRYQWLICYHTGQHSCSVFALNKDIFLQNDLTSRIRKLTLSHNSHRIHNPFNLAVVPNISFISKGSLHTAVSVHVFSAFFSLKQFLRISLTFINLTLVKITGHLFCRMCLILMLSHG